MAKSFRFNHAPDKLLGCQLFDKSLSTLLARYTSGAINTPLILFGEPGAGKTTLAKVLPDAITPSVDPDCDVRFFDATANPTAREIKALERFVKTVSQNDDGTRFLIVDEVDSLSAPAMNALKGLVQFTTSSADAGIYFFMTTNHLNRIPVAIQNRCQSAHVEAPPLSKMVEYASQVLAVEKKTMPSIMLERLLASKAQGGRLDYRSMFNLLERVI